MSFFAERGRRGEVQQADGGGERAACEPTEDAAAFMALAAAVDLSVDACRLFSQRLRKELCQQFEWLSRRLEALRSTRGGGESVKSDRGDSAEEEKLEMVCPVCRDLNVVSVTMMNANINDCLVENDRMAPKSLQSMKRKTIGESSTAVQEVFRSIEHATYSLKSATAICHLTLGAHPRWAQTLTLGAYMRQAHRSSCLVQFLVTDVILGGYRG
ncbi:hypothetical protein Fmac_014855 [Flemingia macrophylla]|uniref:Uncharacterized protein n=1 Tax=Flemingia macrophylla TaxID=520843 RepID=A0ABD1MCX5_9FABA